MKNFIRAAALTSATALLLAACGSAPTDDASTDADASGFMACMVSDEGGFDDKSFNQSGHDGLMKAEADLGIEVKVAESNSDTDYTPNIESMIDEGCDLIIGVGFKLEDSIQNAAESNPDINFALVDSAFSAPDYSAVTLENGKPLLFDTAQASYLAGYVAAGVSETGVVGTYGGMALPSVTIFMDGFSDGIAKFNEDNGTEVALLGWDKTTQSGSFTGDFNDQAKGQTQGQTFLDQNADIIMPVAGPVGMGTIAAITAAESDALIIGVDSDWALAMPESAPMALTSVMKEIGNAVYDTVKAASEGNFTSAPYVGTLANGGVGLAPFHELESRVPADVATKVEQLKQDIIDGKITVSSTSTPK